MKLNHTLTVVAVILAVFTLQSSANAAHTNSGFPGGPRQFEEHPELVQRRSASKQPSSQPAELRNRAWAESPRVREVYPQLVCRGCNQASAKGVQPAKPVNRALAASPRYREEFRAVIGAQVGGE
jgi:hypothetical protein